MCQHSPLITEAEKGEIYPDLFQSESEEKL